MHVCVLRDEVSDGLTCNNCLMWFSKEASTPKVRRVTITIIWTIFMQLVKRPSIRLMRWSMEHFRCVRIGQIAVASHIFMKKIISRLFCGDIVSIYLHMSEVSQYIAIWSESTVSDSRLPSCSSLDRHLISSGWVYLSFLQKQLLVQFSVNLAAGTHLHWRRVTMPRRV